MIKTDGLAAGKGVIVADSNQQACDAVQQLFSVCSCFRYIKIQIFNLNTHKLSLSV